MDIFSRPFDKKRVLVKKKFISCSSRLNPYLLSIYHRTDSSKKLNYFLIFLLNGPLNFQKLKSLWQQISFFFISAALSHSSQNWYPTIIILLNHHHHYLSYCDPLLPSIFIFCGIMFILKRFMKNVNKKVLY